MNKFLRINATLIITGFLFWSKSNLAVVQQDNLEISRFQGLDTAEQVEAEASDLLEIGSQTVEEGALLALSKAENSPSASGEDNANQSSDGEEPLVDQAATAAGLDNNLLLAVLQGDVAQAQNLVAQGGIDLGAQDNDGWTLLHWAALQGSLEIVKYLIEQKIDANVKNEGGVTPLHIAAANGNLDLVRYLVEKAGADYMAKDKENELPIHHMIKHLAVMRYFFEQCKIDINLSINDNQNEITFLHGAAVLGDLEAVKYLLANGARVEVKTNSAPTALHAAARFGHQAIVTYLIEQGHMDSALTVLLGQQPTAAIHAAAIGRHFEIVKYLLRFLPSNDTLFGNTPLHNVILHGMLDEVEKIVKLSTSRDDIDVNAQNALGITPLHFAAGLGRLDMVTCLIEQGRADATISDKQGQTALHYAAQSGHPAVVSYLVQNASMDIDTRDGLGIPALWYAVCGGHLPVVQDLIEKHNANFDDKCSFLRAAIVCKRLPVARYLLTKGATVEQNMCILLPAWSVINNTPDSNLAIAKFLIEEVNIDHCSKDEIRRMLLTQAKSLLQKDVILYLQELTFADPSEN